MYITTKKLLYVLIIWLIFTIGGVFIGRLLNPEEFQISGQTILITIVVGLVFSVLVVFTTKSEFFKPLPTDQEEKLKEFRQTKEFRKVKIVIVICLILILLAACYFLFYNKKKAWLIVIITPILVMIFMGYYQSKLRQFSKITSECAQKLDEVRTSSMKRGGMAGIVFAGLIIIFLIIYFFIQLNK